MCNTLTIPSHGLVYDIALAHIMVDYLRVFPYPIRMHIFH